MKVKQSLYVSIFKMYLLLSLSTNIPCIISCIFNIIVIKIAILKTNSSQKEIATDIIECILKGHLDKNISNTL